MEKKTEKDSKKNVSDTTTNNVVNEIADSRGRTVVVRDGTGEIVLSSTHSEDTLQKMLNQIMVAKGLYPRPQTEQNGIPRYIG